MGPPSTTTGLRAWSRCVMLTVEVTHATTLHPHPWQSPAPSPRGVGATKSAGEGGESGLGGAARARERESSATWDARPTTRHTPTTTCTTVVRLTIPPGGAGRHAAVPVQQHVHR
jgi:hypothetical protein